MLLPQEGFSWCPKISLIFWILHAPMVPACPGDTSYLVLWGLGTGCLLWGRGESGYVWAWVERGGAGGGRETELGMLDFFPSHYWDSSLFHPWEKHKHWEKGQIWAFEFPLMSGNSLLSVELPSSLCLLQAVADLKYKLTVKVSQKIYISYSPLYPWP